MKSKILYLLIVLTLLVPPTTVAATPLPTELPTRPEQETRAQTYLLRLDMPAVELPAGVQPADVPGYFLAALHRRWTEVEGMLQALQDQGLVEAYRLMPEANALRVTASLEAVEHLKGMGALSEQPAMAPMAQAEVDGFQARLLTEIQAAQSQAAPSPQPPEPTTEQPEEPAAAPAPKEPVERPMLPSGTAGVLGTGGPDAYGYRWIDSAEVGGPVYNWIDIATTGTGLLLWDDNWGGYYPIGFPFNFYGVNYTQFYISSNGAIGFGGGTSWPWDTFIAPMLDDLDPGYSDVVYYQSFTSCPYGGGACLVVQYENYHHYWYGDGIIAGTFEVILFGNGDILMQFEDAGAEMGANSWTGIQDDSGTIGLAYADHTPGSLYDGLAVRFYLYRPFYWEPPYQDSFALPDEVAQHTADLVNDSGSADTYTLTVSGNMWPTTLWDETFTTQITNTGSVADGGSATVGVSVTVPSWPGPGDSDIASVVATSWISPAQQAVAQIETSVPWDPPTLYVRGLYNYDEYYHEDTVGGFMPSGFCSPSDGYGTVTLWDSESTLKAQNTNVYACPTFYTDLNVNIEAGDTVEATFAGQTTTVTVPYFEAEVDVEADRVTGVISDAIVLTDTYGLTQTLAVWPQTTSDGGYGKYVLPDVDGAFAATNPFYYRADPSSGSSTLDIDYGNVGHLRYVDADENRVYFRFQPPPGEPVVYVRGRYNRNEYYRQDTVGGYVPGFDSAIHGLGTVTLKDGTGTVKAQRDDVSANPTFYTDLNVNIEAGDTVEATFGEHTTTVQVPKFDTVSDADADTVSGNTDADVVTTTYGLTQTLAVWPQSRYDSGYGKYVLPDGSGDFTAANPFYDDANPSWMSDTLDIQPGDMGHLRYVDADQNRVYDSFQAPMVQVRGDWGGYQGDDYVRVEVDPSVAVTVTLRRGGNVIASASGTSNVNGDYTAWLDDIYGNNAYIQTGDVVEVAYDGRNITVDVPTLEAVADAQADEVTGTGPASVVTTTTGLPHTLQVYVAGWIKNTTTDAAGSFVVTGTVDPGDNGWLRYTNADGYYVYDDFIAPVVYVRGDDGEYQGEDVVSGYATQRNALVRLNLERGGSPVATAYDISNNSGWFWVDLRDVYDNPADIQAGDTVEMSDGMVTIPVAVPTLTADADPDTDIVNGIGPIDVVTTTEGLSHTLEVYVSSPSWHRLNVTTTHSGVYSVTFAPYGGVSPGSWGWLRYINADSNYVYNDFEAAEEYDKPVVYVRGDYWNNRYRAENYVSGYVPGPCGYGTVTLKDSGGAVKAQVTNVWACNSFDVYLYDIYDNSADVEAGDTVEATFGGQTTVVNVPEFDFTSSPDHPEWGDLVYGTTDATVVTDTYGLTQTLAVWPTSLYDSGFGKHVMERLSGTLAGFFVALNPFYDEANPAWGSTDLDWGPGQEGHLRYVDANNNRVYARFQAPVKYTKPTVYVRGDTDEYRNENYLRIYNPDCGDVDVVLKDSAGAVKYESTWWACNWSYSYLGVDIEAGDTVEATSGDQTTVVKVPAFDVTSDPVDDRVTGSTDADIVTTTYGLTQTLGVWPTSRGDWYYGKYVLPDASGVFSAENPFYYGANPASWSTTLNWNPGQEGHLRYVDAGANHVYFHFYAPRDKAEIWVHKDGNWVEGYVITPEGPVTVTLRSSDTVKATAFDTSNADGWFGVNFFDVAGNPVIIEEGDDVVVHSSDTVTVPVVPLSGQADANTDRVSGEGPADALLLVGVDWWNVDKSALTDGSGAYSADFRGIYDIMPGDQVEVQHRNADGHTVYIEFFAGPKVFAQLNAYYAWGYAPMANSLVTLTLKDSSGAVKGSDTDVSAGDNWFDVWLYDATGQRAIIAAGDVLVADFGGGEVVSMTIPGITAQVDADTDMVSGTGPASTPLGVEVGNFDQTVTTDGSGNWSADASGIEDITPGEQVRVRHVNADYHETWLYAVAPVVYVRADGDGDRDYMDDNYVSGWVQGRAVVDVALKRAGMTVATRRLDYGGNDGHVFFSAWLNDALGQPADIMGGDQVVIAASTPFTVTVPHIEATVDADADTVSGTGPADARLGIWVNGYSDTTDTDASGAFSATFDDIDPGDDAYIRYRNPDGHWIHARFRAEDTGAPTIYARWDGDGDVVCDNCVSGEAGTANVLVTLDLQRGGSTVATAMALADNWRDYQVAFTDGAGEAVDIQAGDVIEMTASGPVSMTVAAITVQVNPDAGTLYGTGPAGERLEIRGDCSGNRTVNADGTWFFNCGLDPGDSGYLYHTNADGHRTYLSWAVPAIHVREHGNRVWGWVERGVPVTVRLLTSGGGERDVATTMSDGGGWFNVNFLDAAGNPLIINPNDQVVVESSPATTVPVVPLSAEVDLANDRVIGMGPANDRLDVEAGDCWREVTTGADGSFTADTSGECDLQPGDWIEVSHWNDEGNEVYMEFAAPLLRVNAANDIVDGFATPNSLASLSLRAGGGITATATTFAVTGMDGFFSAFFPDAAGDAIDIQPGDVVDVTASPTMSMTLVELSANVVAATDVVTGTGPANALLYLKVVIAPGIAWHDESVWTDGDGKFTADFSGEFDLTDVSYAYVRYSDANGHQSSIHSIPASSNLQDAAEQAVMARGAMVEKSAFGMANDGDLTPPIWYDGGGGRLVFVAQNKDQDLVLTRPGGSVDDTGANLIIVDGAPVGRWKIQVRVWGGEGDQYAVAVGLAAHQIYLPVVMRSG